MKGIYTIGHSTRSIEEFINMLASFAIQHLVDVRSYPGSRKYPHFNKEELEKSLPENGILYTHMVNLGGRRKPLAQSINNAWRNDSFKGYADYMMTDKFEDAVKDLEKLASSNRVAIMCSEAVWWRCHRSMISDWLKINGWQVHHIMQEGRSEEHPYTKPARIVEGKLTYSLPSLFDQDTNSQD